MATDKLCERLIFMGYGHAMNGLPHSGLKLALQSGSDRIL